MPHDTVFYQQRADTVCRFDVSVYVKKLKKRLVTLMVPYCIWVLAWSAAGILIVNYCKISFPVIDEKIGLLRDNALKAFFSTPLPFQFWYIADLFKLAILSPIVYLLVKKLKIFAVILAAVPWVFDYAELRRNIVFRARRVSRGKLHTLFR